MRLDQMRHGATDAAMAITQEATMGVERDWAMLAEMARADLCCSLAATGKAKIFQQHRQRDGEAVIDRGIADIGNRDAGRLPGARDGDLGAEFGQCRCCRDVLMRMCLCGA